MKRFFRAIGMKQLLANSRGYTMPELVVIMGIIAIFSASAIPNYSRWVLKRQVDGEAKKLSMELQLARISAIKNNNNVRVTFNNPAANQYTVHDDSNNDNVVNGGEIVKTVPLIPRVSFGVFGAGIIDPNGTVIVNPITLTTGGTVLIFNSRGQASASGSVSLIPTSEAGLSNLLLRSVSFIQATGNVEYWEYLNDSNTWL
jgi:Tfp pilus assembly protein FimT